MKINLRSFLINTGLVIGSLTVAFFLIQFLGLTLLQNDILLVKILRRSQPLGVIRTFNDVRNFATTGGRTGEIASVVMSLNLEEKVKIPKPPIDLKLRAEPSALRLKKSLRHRISIPSRNGLIPNINHTVVMEGMFSKKEKVRAHYTTDSFGRRLTGSVADSHKKKNLVFLGCSFTHGLGVNDEDSFPYKVREKTGLNVYNLGIKGSSPSETLEIVRDMKSEYFGDINKEDTSVIYTIIPDHIGRMIGTALHFRFNKHSYYNQPYIYEEGNELVIRKSFSEDKTYGKLFLKLISHIHFLEVFGTDLPWIGQEHHQLIARVLQEIEKELKASYPQVKNFFVALYPIGGRRPGEYETLRDTLVKNNLSVLDYSMLNTNTLLPPYNTLDYDSHPGPLSYDLYSSLLVHDLRKILKI